MYDFKREYRYNSWLKLSVSDNTRGYDCVRMSASKRLRSLYTWTTTSKRKHILFSTIKKNVWCLLLYLWVYFGMFEGSTTRPKQLTSRSLMKQPRVP